MSVMEEIKRRIDKLDDGEIIMTSDFTDLSNIVTIRKCLGRCTSEGIIKRVIDGVYVKPKFSKLLNSYLPADPEKVAYAIAKNYHWTIAPSGDIVLNKLGLTTQVPVVWIYVSDGPYREYAWNNVKIMFKHRTNREISNLSIQTVMIIEALKTLGKERVDSTVISHLSNTFKKNDKVIILKEAGDCSEWIREIIKEVCK